VVVLPCLVYLNSLPNPFHYDDGHSIVDNPHVRTLGNIPRFFVDPEMFSAQPENAMYRPLLLTTFALNYALSGYAVWSYHLVGILLHASCAWLVASIGRLLLRDERAALAAALAFGLHPVNSEAVNYLSSRSEVLAGLFFLLAFWNFLRRRQGEGRLAWIGGAFLAGLLSKSTVVVLPAVLLVHDLLYRRRPADLRLYALVGGLALLYVGLVWKFLAKAALGAPVRAYDEQFWSQVKALVLYLKLLLWPSGLSVDHQFLVSDALLDPFAASAFGFVLSLAWLAFYHRNRHPLLLFCLAWFLLALAPSSLVPLNVLFNEHRLYVPSAAFAWAAGYAYLGLTGRGEGWAKATQAAVVVALLAYAATTSARNTVWRDALSLWGDAAEKAPLMARPFFFLGDAYAKKGRLQEAMAALEQGLKRDSGFAPAHVQLGRLYLEGGRAQEAERLVRRGLELEGDSAEAWAALAEVYRAGNRWEESLDAYQQAVRLNPEDSGLHNNLGNTYQMLNRPRQALEHHRWALELDPDDARTLVNLGNAHWMLGERAQAQAAYQRAVEKDSLYAGAWLSLGQAHEAEGRTGEARRAYEKAASLEPEYARFLEERRGFSGEGRHD
jgi:tetratricopeptide (TPR) repeat protein